MDDGTPYQAGGSQWLEKQQASSRKSKWIVRVLSFLCDDGGVSDLDNCDDLDNRDILSNPLTAGRRGARVHRRRYRRRCRPRRRALEKAHHDDVKGNDERGLLLVGLVRHIHRRHDRRGQRNEP